MYDKVTCGVVSTIGCIGEAPFVMKGKTKNKKFMAVTDFCSPVTTITTDGLKKTHCTNELLAGPLPQSDIVRFNERPRDIARFSHVETEVGKQELKRAQTLVTAKSRLLVGCD